MPGANLSQCLPLKLGKVSPNKGGDLPEVAFEDRGYVLTSPALLQIPVLDPVPNSLHE